MRIAASLKTVCAVAALTIGICGATTAAYAGGSEECQQSCADQWAVDKQSCQDRLDADLARIAADEAACLAAATNPIAQGLCVRKANTQRFGARRNYQSCISRANTTAFNCYRNCVASDSQPALAPKSR